MGVVRPLAERFDLADRVILITGGAGLLGRQHAHAVAEVGGSPILLDLPETDGLNVADEIGRTYGVSSCFIPCDVTKEDQVRSARSACISEFNRIDGLINNATIDPKVGEAEEGNFSRLETFELAQWEREIAVGLTGAMLCSKVFGHEMAMNSRGVIVNIASDLGVIAPDQRIYREDEAGDESSQPVKPVTYSVIKHGLVGLTKYLATYWADRNIRVNALSPGGVYNGQADDFVERLSGLIPMGRMAHLDEYRAAIVFLCSDASSYMTGHNLIVDGGRSVW